MVSGAANTTGSSDQRVPHTTLVTSAPGLVYVPPEISRMSTIFHPTISLTSSADCFSSKPPRTKSEELIFTLTTNRGFVAFRIPERMSQRRWSRSVTSAGAPGRGDGDGFVCSDQKSLPSLGCNPGTYQRGQEFGQKVSMSSMDLHPIPSSVLHSFCSAHKSLSYS